MDNDIIMDTVNGIQDVTSEITSNDNFYDLRMVDDDNFEDDTSELQQSIADLYIENIKKSSQSYTKECDINTDANVIDQVSSSLQVNEKDAIQSNINTNSNSYDNIQILSDNDKLNKSNDELSVNNSDNFENIEAEMLVMSERIDTIHDYVKSSELILKSNHDKLLHIDKTLEKLVKNTNSQVMISPERLIIRCIFKNVCEKHKIWTVLSEEKQETIIRRIERSCFDAAIQSCILDGIDRLFTEKKFVERYSANCSKILSNIDSTKDGSVHLLTRIISNKIDLHKIAELSSMDLCPEASRAERDEITFRQQIKIRGKVSHAYVCRKCGGNETIPIEYQSRAVDEGSSFSIKCVNCEFVWRRT